MNKPRIRQHPEQTYSVTSFLSSLSSEQQLLFKKVLSVYETYYSNYYHFGGSLIKQNGFVSSVWESKLFNDVVKPTGINKAMFRLILLIHFLKLSRKHNDEQITFQLIMKYAKDSPIYRLRPVKSMAYLVKYGWINYKKLSWGKRSFYLSEKAVYLLEKYQFEFKKHFDNMFKPLSL